MKNFLLLIPLILLLSCADKRKEDPLILPPNFSEMPDLKHPEKPSKKVKQENVEKLKELLLDSE